MATRLLVRPARLQRREVLNIGNVLVKRLWPWYVVQSDELYGGEVASDNFDDEQDVERAELTRLRTFCIQEG